MSKTGSCLCGAVKYSVESDIAEAGICHCGMCRKWTGGINIAVEAKPDDVTFEGANNITTYPSSEWGERCFCSICCSSLYFRITMPGPHFGTYYFGMGTIDDPGGITVTQEIFTDRKPEGYALAGNLDGMTEAEFMAMYSEEAPQDPA